MPNSYVRLMKLLQIEEVEVNTMYTLTLSKKVAYSTSYKSKINQYLYFIRKYIQPYMIYELVPELSSVGRLHYHGICIFRKKRDIWLFYSNIYGVSDCAIEIDTIDDLNKWLTYVTKQESYRFIFEELLLPYRLRNTKKPLKRSD